MKKKQTAVQWLEYMYINGENYSVEAVMEWLKQAKQMEKEQIIDAYYQCGRDNFEHIKVINRSATDYYNETYE